MPDKVKDTDATAFSPVKPSDMAFRCDGSRDFVLY